MAKSIYFLCLILLPHIQVHCASPVPNPHGLIDVVKEQVQELRIIVTASINGAFDSIDDLLYKTVAYFANTQAQVEISIQDTYDTLVNQLNIIKQLASSSGQNIEHCLQEEEFLHQLPKQSLDNFRNYFESATASVNNLETTYKYRVDVLINEVDVLDFQIRQCGEEILCVLPIVSKIETAKTTLPERIDTETIYIRNSLDLQMMMIYTYSFGPIGRVNIEGRNIIETVSACINEISF